MDSESDESIELEEQFILRLPLVQADVVRKSLKKSKSKKFKKLLKICLDEDNRTGTVIVKKRQLHAKIVDLPCIVDSNKTTDKAMIFKTANISQIMICQEEEFEDGDECSYPHGLAPSLKNGKKRRFRKVLRNEENPDDIAEIEKEVIWLLRADNEAVSTRFEFFYDEEKPINECSLFGEVITDSDTDLDTSSKSNSD
ncbi:hypothetical protein RN001_010804 [Aquatica leii]|uniref:TAFII55 protein conserved region domain-containing protein n=1 Tax=Aquatica leii TaxID=1421715 RepID=A0AAN7QHR5_9COLE|nr:hypothetical protein RN001_010804 [Aquatica leii]